MARRFVIGSAWVNLRADGTGLRTEIRTKVREAVRGIDAKVAVNVDVDDASLTLLKRKMAMVSDKSVRIRVHTDNQAVNNLNTMLRTVDKFTGKFANVTRLLNFSGLNFAPLVAAGAAAATAAPMLVSLASSMGLASAASAAAIPAFFGLTVAFIGLKGAFSPVGTALKDYGSIQDQVRKGTITAAEGQLKMNRILGQLRPSVRGLVVEMLNWKDRVLPGLTSRIQDNLFPALTRLFSTMEMHTPLLSRFFDSFSRGAATAVERLRSFVASSQFGQQLSVMLMGSSRAFGQLGLAGVAALRAIMTIGEGATPILVRFATWVRVVAERFAAWLDIKRQTGELAAFFKAAADEASKWGQILFNFLAGIFNIMRAANPSGRELSTSLLQISQRFREWTGANIGKMQNFFDRIHDIDWGMVIRGISAITALVFAVKMAAGFQAIVQGVSAIAALGPIAGPIVGAIVLLGIAFAVLYTHSRAFREFVHEKLLPTLKQAAEIIFPAIKKALHDITSALRDSGIPWQTVLAVVLKLVIGQAMLLAMLIRVAGWLYTGYILSLTTAIKWLQGFAFVVTHFGQIWQATWQGVANFFAFVWNWIAAFVSDVWGRITQSFVASWDNIRNWFGGRLEDLKNIWWSTWNWIWRTIGAWFGLITGLWVGAWDNLRGWFGGRLEDLKNIWWSTWNWLWQTIGAWFGAITSLWVAAWNNLRKWFGDRLEDLKNLWWTVWRWIWQTLGAWWQAITSTWVSLWNNLRGWFGGRLEDLKNIWWSAWNIMHRTVAAWLTAISATISRIWAVIQSNFFHALDALRNKFSQVWNSLDRIAQGAMDKVLNVLRSAWNAIAGLIEGGIRGVAKLGSLFGWKMPSDWQRFPRLAHGGEAGKDGYGPVRKAAGGPVGGYSPHSTADNIPALLTAGEEVIQRDSARRIREEHPGLLSYMNKTGQLPPGITKMAFGGAALGHIWRGGIAQAQNAIRALYQWAGGRAPETSGYRPGDPLWHGTGLAGDFGAYNQDTVARKLMSVRGGLLELIHATPRGRYGVSRGKVAGNMPWASHYNHLHLAATPPDIQAILGGKIPMVGGGGGDSFFDLAAEFLNPAKAIMDKIFGSIKDDSISKAVPKHLAMNMAPALINKGGSLLQSIVGFIKGLFGKGGGDGHVMGDAFRQAKFMHASNKTMLALFEAGFVESGFRNLRTATDHDSLGFLQQRPSAGWGTPAQILNVPHATQSFVSRAQRIESRFRNAGALAQAVQVSAFPGRYQQQRGNAVKAIRRFEPGWDPNGYKRGTSSATPGWHMVGENGPEWMNMQGGESIKTETPVNYNFYPGAIVIDAKNIDEWNKVVSVLRDLPTIARAGVRKAGP